MPRLARFAPAPARRLFRRLFPHRPADFPQLWADHCQKWLLGGLDDGGCGAALHGWLVAPPAVRPHVRFGLADADGTPIPVTTDYPRPRPDVAAHLPGVADAAESGFVVAFDPPASGPGDLRLSVADARTGRPLGNDYQPLFVPSAARFGPAPEGRHARRVIGPSTDFDFRYGGYTAFRRLEDAVGTPLADFPRVLDWGCGFGRVARYFTQLPGTWLTGVDVDAEAVAWCRANLPAADWRTIPLRPPTDLPAGGFDLAYGLSVFTHLSEPDQDAWLAELARVVRPGGLALMTFHGPASVYWSGLPAGAWAALRRDGFCDIENHLYDADLGEAGYYRDAFHTEGYVRRVWGRHFEVTAVRPSFVAHQDLAVLRRR